MSSRNNSNENEKELFRAAVSGTKPLVHNKVTPYQRRLKPIPKQLLKDQTHVLEEAMDGRYDTTLLETGDELLFLRSGVQKRVMRKLRKGDFTVQGELDLHGMTQKQAHEHIIQFINQNILYDKRCVRIVHGKGLGSPGKIPILKNLVNKTLTRIDKVLAFCSTPSNDGGTGAVYVLLKKSNSDRG